MCPLARQHGLADLKKEGPSMRPYPVLAAVLAIFASLLLAQPSPSRLTVVVEDLAGAPIPGASVLVLHWVRPEGRPGSKHQLIQDGGAITDNHGRVSFELAPTVIYHVFASAPQFVPAAASVGDFGETGHVFKLAIGQGGGVRVESLPK